MLSRALNIVGIRTFILLVRTQVWSYYLRRVHKGQIRNPLPRGETVEGVALLATNVGSNLSAVVGDSVISRALQSRGFEVKVVLCDGALPACMACTSDQFRSLHTFVKQGPSRLYCKACFSGAKKVFESISVDVIRLSEFVRPVEAHWNSTQQLDDHARAGTIRFLKSEINKDNLVHKRIFQRYLEAAKLVATAYEQIYAKYRVTQVVAHHGIYVPQGAVVQVARRLKISVATWTVGYRKSSIIYGVGDTYHRTMITDTSWQKERLDALSETSIMNYLLSRERGSQDAISFVPRPRSVWRAVAESSIEKKIRSKPDRRVVALYTNVVWDASIHFENAIFNGMLDWLGETLHLLSKLNCWVVIRIHPAERRGLLASEQDVLDEIKKQFNEIPDNFIIVNSRSAASSYEIARMSGFAITFASKIAIELAARAIPVIVAGQGWTRNKGFTTDPSSKSDYLSIVKQWVSDGPDAMTSKQIEAARQFAHNVFFVKMRKLNSLKPRRGYPPFSISKTTFGPNGEFRDSELLNLTEEWTSEN